MTSSVPLPDEPAWKIFVSWQMGFAILFGVLFWLTVTRVNLDEVPSEEVIGSHASERYASLQIFTDIANMPASQLLAKGDAEGAIAAAQALAKQDPYDVANLMCAGDILCSSARTADDGFKLLRRAVYLAPQSRYVRLDYARKLTASKRYEEAIVQYEVLARKFPQQWTMPRYELANLYMEMKQFEPAVEQLQTALHSDTRNGTARKLLGIAMAANNEEDDGFEEFKKGVSLEQNQGYPGEVADVLKRNGDSVTKAIEDMQAQVAKAPENHELKLKLAHLYVLNRQADAAKKALTELITADNTNPSPHFVLAQMLCNQNNLPDARSEFKAGVQLEQNRPG